METIAPRAGPPPRRMGQRADTALLQRQPLLTITAAAAAGVLSGDWLSRPPLLLSLTVSALAGWWLSRPPARPHARGRRPGRIERAAAAGPAGQVTCWGWLAVLMAVASCFALLRLQTTERLASSPLRPLLTDEWQPVVLEARLIDRVELRPNRLAALRGQADQPAWQSVFGVAVERLRRRAEWQSVAGHARVMVDGDCSARAVGDRVRIYGQIQAIPAPRNPGGLDLRPTYAARGQIARIRVATRGQVVLQRRPWFAPQRFVGWVGTAGERLLRQQLGESDGPLAAALVLGRREAVDPKVRTRLLETGTAHLLSVSGMHLGMVAVAATWCLSLSGVSRRRQIVAVVLVCLLYAAITGGRPPVLRAALIVLAVLMGMWRGRLVHPLNALAFAALVLLLLNPANLHSVGVHLSFVAVGTLIFASRQLIASDRRRRLNRDPLDAYLETRRTCWRRGFAAIGQRCWQAGRLSFWVWLITAPLVWHQFHIVTPISVVANLLLSGPLLVALISGLTTVCCGLVWAPLALVPACCCRGALRVIDGGVEWLAAIPGGHFWLPAPPGWWILIFYLALPVGGWLLPGRIRSTWIVAGLSAWFAIALALATVGRRCWLEAAPAGTLEIVFIDVGHGTSVLLRHPTGGNWLYDCGRLGDPQQSARPIEGVLWHKGIRHLDGILLSHADSDHYNALPRLLRRFSIGRVITAPGVLETDEPGLRVIREAIRRAGVPIDEAVAGDSLFRQATVEGSGEATVDGPAWGHLLHPPADFVASLDNARSLVLQVDHAGCSLVLPGDVELPGTDTLLRCPRPTPGGILMAPHHGSLQQSPRPILDWARPGTVIVSGSERADRPAVYRALRQAGADVHVTAACGAITLRIDAQGRRTFSRWLAGAR